MHTLLSGIYPAWLRHHEVQVSLYDIFPEFQLPKKEIEYYCTTEQLFDQIC